jgi:phosphopentomutase
LAGVEPVEHPDGWYGKMAEASKGKDSTTGHWELSGIVVEKDFPYYPKGFPESLIRAFCEATGAKGILGNKAASGTVIIQELGDDHRHSGFPIVYTSADSVFQIAAHDDIIPLAALYDMCAVTRQRVCVNEHAVGRVIARPFVGTSGHYVRTPDRRDFSLLPPGRTVLDLLTEHGIATIGIGKIDDLFAGRGLSEKIHTKSNEDGIRQIIAQTKASRSGFIMANLVDFDMLYGHRQNPRGMADAILSFDASLSAIVDALGEDDLLMLTADHGNDPTDDSTDHSREYVPILCYGKNSRRDVKLGMRESFADAGKTVADFYGLRDLLPAGISFLSGETTN